MPTSGSVDMGLDRRRCSCYRVAVVHATPARRVATRAGGCDACGVREREGLPLYGVGDFHRRLARRDLLIAVLALAAGVGAMLLVLGSERERSPVAASAT